MVPLTAACALWLATPALMGLETNAVVPRLEASDDALTNSASDAQIEAEAADTNSSAAETPAKGMHRAGRGKAGSERNAVVVFGRDAELKAGETADAVVVIGGSAKVHGHVRDAVVAIGGDVDVDGEVGDAVVAVLGSVRAGQGAKIHGDVVAVGGKVDVAEDAKIDGEQQSVDFGGLGLPKFDWLKKWIVHCVLKFRPLAPQVGWVWAVAGIFFLLYLFIAAVFPRPVQACVDELTRRPATSFLLGLLTKLFVPLVFLILAVTVIGLVVVPFILVALILGGIVGKVAVLEWLGLKIARQFGVQAIQKPLAGFLVGTIIVTLLYLVPVLGLLTFFVLSLWGLGAAVLAAVGGLRRELPERPAAPAPGAAGPPTAGASGVPSVTSFSASPGDSAPPTQAVGAAVPAPPPVSVSEVLSYPKAGFWERMAAAALDIVLLSILGHLVGGPPMGFIVALAYFTGMWAWKGTTVGGIVLGLKVVRFDGQPVSFAVALIRSLAAAFSMIVIFLGFLWIAWDRDKQGWHDKIAGTIVLRLPRGTPLVCI